MVTWASPVENTCLTVYPIFILEVLYCNILYVYSLNKCQPEVILIICYWETAYISMKLMGYHSRLGDRLLLAAPRMAPASRGALLRLHYYNYYYREYYIYIRNSLVPGIIKWGIIPNVLLLHENRAARYTSLQNTFVIQIPQLI